MPILLATKVEERYSQHCVEMSYLLVGQDQALATRRIAGFVSTIRVEVKQHYMQLCHASTHFTPLDGCCMGYYG